MSKQEEIAETLQSMIACYRKQPYGSKYFANEILEYLYKQGVVIQGQSLGFSHPHLANYYTVDPLIEVKK